MVIEYDGTYPEGNKFGDTNASAFFIRHTDSVSFLSSKVSFDESDARPWLVEEDVKSVSILGEKKE